MPNNKYSKNKELNIKEKRCEKERKKKNNNCLGEDYEDPLLNEVNAKLREKLIRFGRKTLFNFLTISNSMTAKLKIYQNITFQKF